MPAGAFGVLAGINVKTPGIRPVAQAVAVFRSQAPEAFPIRQVIAISGMLSVL